MPQNMLPTDLVFQAYTIAKKNKAYILKYKALISKYMACIFHDKACVFSDVGKILVLSLSKI